MKPIKPISIWKNGNFINANFLDLNISFDNLINIAYLNYFLYSENFLIDTGTITIDGDIYKNWDGSAEETYLIGSKQLNIQLA